MLVPITIVCPILVIGYNDIGHPICDFIPQLSFLPCSSCSIPVWAVNSGVNQIQSIQYVLSNSLQTQLQNQALKNAIASANQTALLTALSENVKVVGIQSVTVLGSNYQQPYTSYGLNVVEAPAASVNYSVPIAPGQSQYTMQVQVVYLLG
jgi:uncharacterized protein YggE